MSTEFEKMFMNALSKEQSVFLPCEFSCSKLFTVIHLIGCIYHGVVYLIVY